MRPCRWNVAPPALYQRAYERFAELAGCGDVSAPARRKTRNTLDCLRILSSDDLLAATTKMTKEDSLAGLAEIPWNIVEDGYFYPKIPSKVVASGNIAPIPIIAGSSRSTSLKGVAYLVC